MLSIFIVANCYADLTASSVDPKLWRYSDKITGDEKGVCYSEKAIDNPSWNSQVIKEDQKDYYIKLKNQQDKAKQEQQAADKDAKAKKCADKLKALGFDKDDISLILGDAYGS